MNAIEQMRIRRTQRGPIRRARRCQLDSAGTFCWHLTPSGLTALAAGAVFGGLAELGLRRVPSSAGGCCINRARCDWAENSHPAPQALGRASRLRPWNVIALAETGGD